MNWKLREHIRKEYKRINLEPFHGAMISPYALDLPWMTLFSPIESLVWDAIRYLGIPLYPQFPVGNYFADFADPQRKIVIEVDSIRWHKDKRKDDLRDKEMRSLGWRVFRIPSHMVYKSRPDFTDADGNTDWDSYYNECAEGLLWDLYRNSDEYKPKMVSICFSSKEMMDLALTEIFGKSGGNHVPNQHE